MRELRDYQLAGLDSLRQTIRQKVKRIVLQLPTGGGKTLCAATIASGALSKGNKLAFVVPRISLIDQTIEEFYSEGIREIGVIQANHSLTDWSKPIQVCSIDTIRSKGVFPESSVVVFDEVHLFYQAHKDWMKERDSIFIGLSASPWAKGLGDYFETLLVMATTKQLIAQGWLSKFRVFAAAHPDLRGVKITAGDYNEGQLSTAMQQGTLVADIVKTWQSKWGKDKTLLFAVDCTHAQAIQARFQEAGIPCGYQDAHTLPEQRRAIKRQFHSGELPVVASVGTLILGVDWDVRCISYCRPTRSEMLFVQAIGRGLRLADGKDDCLILDHSDSTQRLGFVDDIHHENLLRGKDKVADIAEKKPAPLPKECKACGYLKPARVSVCPNCGFKAQIVNGLHERDGELIEVTNGHKPKKAPKRELSMEEKSKFFSELKAYVKQKEKKPGYAARLYKERTGVWPDWSIKDVPPAAYASVGTISWIQARNIRWAKSKRHEAR